MPSAERVSHRIRSFDDLLDYWALNFNDFPSGLVTLFVLMVAAGQQDKRFAV